mgnify:FL=1
MENEKDLVFSSEDTFDPDSVSIEGDGFYISTGELASRLNVSRDMVRNHIRDFEDYFDVAYTKEGKGGHIRFPSSQIELLEMIIRLRKTKSVEEVREILDDPEMPYLFNNGERVEKQFGLLLSENNKRMAALLEQAVSKAFDDKISRLIESKDNMLDDKQQVLDEVMELNKKLVCQNQELQGTIESSAKHLKEMQEENQQLKEKMDMILEKLPDSQKRGLFSFFKK